MFFELNVRISFGLAYIYIAFIAFLTLNFMNIRFPSFFYFITLMSHNSAFKLFFLVVTI